LLIGNRTVAGIDMISTRTASNLVGVYYHEAEHPNKPYDPSFHPSDGCKHLGDEVSPPQLTLQVVPFDQMPKAIWTIE